MGHAADLLNAGATVSALAAAWLAAYLIHSTILLGAAWLASGVLGRLNAADGAREALWKAALVGGALTATISITLPQASIDLRSIAASGGFDSAPSVATPSDTPLIETFPEAKETRRFASPPGDIEPAIGAAVAPSAGSSQALLTLGRNAGAVAAGLLILGVCGAATSLALARRRLARALGDRRSAPSPQLREMLEALAHAAAFRSSIRLTLSERLDVPIAFGVLRPEICLPATALDQPPAWQRAMLAHELAHLARRDPLWQIVALVLERLLFLQPLNWVARRHLREISEFQCDRWAVSHTGDALSFARCLANAAERLLETRSRRLVGTWAAFAAVTRPSVLAKRIERAFDTPPRRGRMVLSRFGCTLAVAAIGVVGAFTPRVVAVPPRAVEPSAPIGPIAPMTPLDDVVGEAPAGDEASRIAALQQSLAQIEAQMLDLRDAMALLGPQAASLDASGEMRALLREVERRMIEVEAQRQEIALALSHLARTLPESRESNSSDTPDTMNANDTSLQGD